MQVATRLAKFELHDSITTEQSSIMFKLFIGLFVNTALITLAVNAKIPRFGSSTGIQASLCLASGHIVSLNQTIHTCTYTRLS